MQNPSPAILTRRFLPRLCALLVAVIYTTSAHADTPDCVVVFNEVHYNPAGPAEDGEWIELFNQMGIRVDLSGWQLAGGLDYTFPPGTTINPGTYLVVAKSPAAGQLGPFMGSLDNGGEQLRLLNHSGRLMDSLDYEDSGRWPVVADGSGATLAKRDPYTPNKPPGHWTRSAELGGTPGAENFPSQPPTGETITPLLESAENWRFHQSGYLAPANWARQVHPAGVDGWEAGPGPLAFEPTLGEPTGTTLRWPGENNPYVVTYYFETEFNLSAAQLAGTQSLKLRYLLDDGAIFYLNGEELHRANMPNGPVQPDTPASSGVEAAWSPGITLSTSNLTAGSNRISVEVHQESTTSGDLVLGVELDAVLTEGAAGDLSALRLNELPPFSETPYWIEIINPGTGPLDIEGTLLSVEGDPLRAFPLPARSLGAGEILVVTESEMGFRPLDQENVYLFSPSATQVFDGQRVTGRLRGRTEERAGAWLYPDTPTPGQTNTFTLHDDVVISEIHYNPPPLSALPGSPATFISSTLFDFNTTWRYNDAGDNLPGDWATSAHPVGGNWTSGTGPIGFESSTLSEPLNTVLADPRDNNPYIITYYFEREFTLTAQQLAELDSLQVIHQIDDGAVIYLNGVEARRINLPGGTIGSETTSLNSVNNAALQSSDLDAALDALVPGLNRISVEVHQVSDGSSDIVFGLLLQARTIDTPGVPAQPFRRSTNQWVEIANRSTTAVNLGGWQFDDGIAFTFPPNTILSAGEHACVARDTALFTAAYPGSRLLGEFSGRLSRQSERISLRAGDRNPVDEVRYFEAGRWPQHADGGGTSLELRDLDANNQLPEAWSASDESHQSKWRSYSYRKRGTSNGGPNEWRDFVFGLLDAGEILLDDIRVVESPDGGAVQFLTNTSFESGATGWRMVGNHRLSRVISDPDNPGNKVLHLVSEGATEHMHNHIETTLARGRSVSSSRAYEISFRAKWLTGSNQLHTRLYFNRAAQTTPIDRPLEVGTPSAPNSRSEANIGPGFTHFLHSPPVPDAGQPVTVTTTVSDPDGVASISLYYSVDEGPFQRVGMTPLGNGTYQSIIPGQPAGRIVQFYARAADPLGATAFFPARGPDSRAQYKVQDGKASGTGIHNFRIVMQDSDADFMHTPINVMSNGRVRATVIDREEEIYYDVGIRIKGGQRARMQNIYLGFNVLFGAERLYRGVHRTIGIDRSGSPNEAPTELMLDLVISNSGGSPSRYTDLLHVIAPRDRHTGSSILQMARYSDVFLDSQYENGSDGFLYDYELIYYPRTADPNGFKIPEPDTVIGQNVGDLGSDPERYRWFFLTKNNRAADNFEPIIRYNQQFGKSGAAFEDGLEEVLDVDGWLRGFAYSAMSGAGDGIASGFEHNGMYYARPDGRVISLPHDMDYGWNAGLSIWSNPECSKLTQDGRRRRIYLGHLHDLISTTWNQGYLNPWRSHFNSLDPAGYWNSTLSYMNSRAANVLSQINSSIPPVNFSITTSNPLTIDGSAATISGEGWVNVRSIRLAGSPTPLVVNWTDGNSWQLTIPTQPGQNTISLQAVDFSGQILTTDSIVINNTSTIEPAGPANLAVTELMYNASDLTPAEVAAGFQNQSAFEYIEVMNIGDSSIDLTGVQFTEGITFAFPSMTLEPRARAVIPRNRGAFLARYPEAAASLLTGEYGIGEGNRLSNSGEEILLTGAGGQEIRRFTYLDEFPWPVSPDGLGPSLVLIAPRLNPDHAVPLNWRAGTAVGGTPGGSDAVDFVGDPDADPDGNGLGALLEHALGNSLPPVAVQVDPTTGTATMSFTRNLSADDIAFSIEVSTDLLVWGPGGAERLSSSDNGDGTATESWIIPDIQFDPGQSWFMRLRLDQRLP